MLKNEHAKNHRNCNHPLFLLCSLTVVVVIATTLTTGRSIQAPDKERLSVDDPRPVALAAEMLERKYGWIVTYEDPPYAHESDLVDVTEKVRRDLDKYQPGQAPKVFVPKGGKLELEYDIDPVTKKPVGAEVVVQQLLDTYAATNGKAGAFRLERDGQRLHIIGALAKDKNGVLTAHQSVLETVITLPPQKRNGMMLLEDLCAALSQSSGTRVLLATVPTNLLARYQTEAGAKDQKARTFLVDELDRMTGQARLSWRLLYSWEMKTYYLNLHMV